MSRKQSVTGPVLSVLVIAVLAGGCQAVDPLAPESTMEASTGPGPLASNALDAHPVAASFHTPPRVAGDWDWIRLERLSFPDWFAAGVLGITPEGPVTHARCTSGGTMTLSQSGTAFDGMAVITTQECRTNGGQAFVPPGSALPISVSDGRVSGASLSFSFHNVTVRPCPFHAVIVDGSNGQATVLEGSGRCVLPGHPRSDSPVTLDPPPGGTSVAVSWTANRQ